MFLTNMANVPFPYPEQFSQILIHLHVCVQEVEQVVGERAIEVLEVHKQHPIELLAQRPVPLAVHELGRIRFICSGRAATRHEFAKSLWVEATILQSANYRASRTQSAVVHALELAIGLKEWKRKPRRKPHT